MKSIAGKRITSLLAAAAILAAAAAGARAASGSQLFASNCIVCHQPDAKGVQGIYPPLADTVGTYARLKQGRAYLVHVPSFGLTGVIATHGETIDGNMPPVSQLNDEEIAAVINYILTKFNQPLLPSDFKPLTPDEVHGYRAKDLSENVVRNEREALLEALKKAGDLK